MGGGASGTIDVDYGDGTTIGGGGGGGSGPNSPDYIGDVPDGPLTLLDLISYLNQCITLDSTLNNWLLQNDTDSNLTKRLLLYANENQCSEETKNFAKAAIEAWMEDGEVDFDLEIINELTGKAKCLDSLLTKNGTNFVKDLLKNFEGESEFDIKIRSQDKVVSKGKEVNATTTKPVNKIITINISSSKLNQHAALDGARTILHEYIHADIFRKLNTKYIEDLDFKRTYDAYGTQHEVMGALYVNKMRDALKYFHKNVLTEDFNKYTAYYGEVPSDDFYEALAWRGLKEHNVKAWTDLSTERQEEINELSIRVDVLTKAVICSN